MSENTPKPSATFNSEALVAVQRRNVEAFTSAGKIVAAGMRTYADRQASMMREGLHTLWSELQTDGRALMTGVPVHSSETPLCAYAAIGRAVVCSART